MFRFIILFYTFIILSGCGTAYRIIEEPYYNPERGQSFYNPYNPYYQAVRADGKLALPACGLIIVGCPFIIMDLPISFVTDTLMLPYDLTRGAYIKYYNKQHMMYENYGPFIFKYSHIYKTGDFLDIYHLTLDNPLTSQEDMGWGEHAPILSFQAKLLEKRLTPTPRLWVEDRFGAVFLVDIDPKDKANVRRIGDHSDSITLAKDPNIRVFYRKAGSNHFSPRCTMFDCTESLDEAPVNFYTFDTVVNYKDLSIISSQLPTKYPEIHCEEEQSTNNGRGSLKECIIQYYLLSLSPDQQQAVYLSNTGKLWVLDMQGAINFITDLDQQQQQSLNKLLDENKQKEQRYLDLTDKKQQESYKKDSLTLYGNYITWFTANFKWQQEKNNHWQVINSH